MTTTVEGYCPAVVTPFNEAGDIMVDCLEEVIRWHLKNGADAICLAGDNGEAWALSHQDRKILAETGVRVVDGKVPVLMGASATTARQTIEYAEIAAKAGIDVLMTGPQSYVMKSTIAEMVGRFEALNKAVPLPILLYNSPRRTGLNLDVKAFAAICDAVPVVGVKEASRDFFHTSHMLRLFKDRVSILIGPCIYLLPALALGAKGFIATGPEFLGPTAARLRAVAAEKPGEEFQRLHHALVRIYEFLMGHATWPAALKAGLNMLGVPAGVPHEPVQPLGPDDTVKLQALLRELALLPEGTGDASLRATAAE